MKFLVIFLFVSLSTSQIHLTLRSFDLKSFTQQLDAVRGLSKLTRQGSERQEVSTEQDKEKDVNPTCKKPSPYDLLILALQWSPALCIDETKNQCNHKNVFNYFTIHGLWPTRRNNPRGPFNCCGSPLNTTEITSAIDGLEKVWASVYKSGNEKFWTKEWNKHGTCASGSNPKITNPLEYFKTTISLYNNLDVKEWLSKRDIRPSPDKFYNVNDVQSAIQANTNGNLATLICRSHNRTRYLKEIRLCLEPKTLNFVSCPRLHQGCRGGKFKITPKKVDFD